MNCLANRKPANKAVKDLVRRQCKSCTNYFVVAIAEIFLDKYHWSKERTIALLNEFDEQFKSVNAKNVEVRDFSEMLKEEYGYESRLKNTLIRDGVTNTSQRIDLAGERCIYWLADILATVLFDKFGWSESTVRKFFASYYDKYIPLYKDGAKNFDKMLKNVNEHYDFNLEVYVK